ncbi:MAG TPA: hypothetical protein VFC86_04210, partial [Planctomycetota bacterium]|nr:hypothetical protein [Planctomycetota bacterium]
MRLAIPEARRPPRSACTRARVERRKPAANVAGGHGSNTGATHARKRPSWAPARHWETNAS